MNNRAWTTPLIAVLAIATARAATVNETVHGVIGGKHTKDSRGYFGARGSDLTGQPFTVVLSYVSQDFNQTGKCKNNSCDYYNSHGTPAVPQSVQISVKIAGVTQTYTPTNIAAVFLSISGAPFFAIDSDAYSGFGEYGSHGVQLYFQVMSNPKFGKALSPGDPVLNHKASIDQILFFDKSSQTATEQLDLNVGRSGP